MPDHVIPSDKGSTAHRDRTTCMIGNPRQQGARAALAHRSSAPNARIHRRAIFLTDEKPSEAG